MTKKELVACLASVPDDATICARGSYVAVVYTSESRVYLDFNAEFLHDPSYFTPLADAIVNGGRLLYFDLDYYDEFEGELDNARENYDSAGRRAINTILRLLKADIRRSARNDG